MCFPVRLEDLAEAKKKRDEKVELTWRDYIALSVALVETVMVPAIVLIVILLLLVIFASRIR